jgi:hypothetical protein
MLLKSRWSFFCPECGEELSLSQGYYGTVFVLSSLMSALITYLIGVRGILFLLGLLVGFYLFAGYGSFLWGVILKPPKLHVAGDRSIAGGRRDQR